MKIIFNTLKEATDFIEKLNKNSKYNAYFKGTNGEVHVIVEEKAISFLN